MKDLLAKLGERVMGVLSGFDRLVFRGILRGVMDSRGMAGHLYGAKVKMADFKDYAKRCTTTLIAQSLSAAQEQGREIRYLPGNKDVKKDLAQQIADRDRIDKGLICVLRAVEPCNTFEVKRDHHKKTIELEYQSGKCLHLYHYFQHERFGLMHVRLQTWFPFQMQVCLNGHEWLARQLTAAGIGFEKFDNGIHRVDDIAAAQRLYREQLQVSWPELLGELRGIVHPAHDLLFANCPPEARQYYWSMSESEWSSDLLLKNPHDAERLTEQLVRGSILTHGVGDILRFMGRPRCADGLPRVSFLGTLKSNIKRFETGVRIKHSLNSNSVKAYNKPGLVRIETTINDPSEFKVFRTRENHPEEALQWLPMRKGVADLHRRAEVSQAVNDRYATALAATLDDSATIKELTSPLCQAILRPGREKADGTRTKSRQFRGLNPLSAEDLKLLETVSRPEFTVSGLRNKDVRQALFGADSSDAKEHRRRSSAASRKLSLLRAHGLLEKVSQSHTYRVPDRSRLALSALLAASNSTLKHLNQLAA